jgi:hypothetical protein
MNTQRMNFTRKYKVNKEDAEEQRAYSLESSSPWNEIVLHQGKGIRQKKL